MKIPSIIQKPIQHVLGAGLLLAAASACAPMAPAPALSGSHPIHGRSSTIPDQPVSVRIHGKFIDEDSPLEHQVFFRNTGSEIVSFDYTLSDVPGVPHVDRDGPNSGLVANLYPGAEVEVPNPLKKSRLYVVIGSLTHGKKSAAQLDAIYRSTAIPSPQGEKAPAQ
jgi:hypothetical protein